jgi:D-3-phosphoglycerate dehydrogenase / 2-oxoglutarate reductase
VTLTAPADAVAAVRAPRRRRRTSRRTPARTITPVTMFATMTTTPAALGASARYAPRGGDALARKARAASGARAISVVVRAGGGASDDDEVALLEKALKLAKARKTESAKAPPAAVVGGGSGYSGASFNVKTFNAISPVGLNKFPAGKYAVSGDDKALPGDPMAIMLRSHKLQANEVPPTVRGIVRCGAGTNNIPVKEMSEMGIPVFNTPGANANAVKELVVCSLLLASRGIIEGNRHVNEVINVEEGFDYAKIDKRIEKDKAMFGGREIEGKTLGVIGLGAIGSRYVRLCLSCQRLIFLEFLSTRFFSPSKE